MTLALLRDEERELVNAVLWFANKKSPRPEEVERRFSKLPLIPGVFQTVADYKGDREELAAWLKQIEQSRRGQQEVAKKVSALMSRTVHAAVTFAGGQVRYAYGVTGVEGIRALGVALILDERGGLTKRLRQCGACGRFNLQLEKKMGRPRRFCSSTCKRVFDAATGAERVAKWRATNKKTSLKRLDQ